MFKSRIISALALVAAAGIAHAAPDSGAMPTSITLDGYCDGVTNIKYFANAGYLTGTHAYENCGGYSDTPMVGPIGTKLDGNKIGIAATDSSYPQFGLTFLYIFKNDHTWNLVSPEGGVLNMGTWSSGFEVNGTQGGVPSFTH
jgi:hypothetical protein